MVTNPNTPAQTDVRSTLADVSKQWKSLSAARRAAWEYYALAHPRLDSLGQTITLTGLQMFVSINTLLVTCGLAEAFDAPDATVLAAPVIGVGDPSIAADCEIDFTVSPVAAGSLLLFYSSPPLSAGVNFNRDYRLVSFVAPAETSPYTIYDDLVAKWGTVTAGMKFFLRSKLLKTTGGGAGVVSADSNVIELVTTA